MRGHPPGGMGSRVACTRAILGAVAWRIHSWEPSSRTGTVESPHFGPWPFGPAENPTGATHFACGDRVLVELDGPKGAYVVRSVAPACQPQPEGTVCADLSELNAGHPGEMRLEEEASGVLRFWVGDCCQACADSWMLTFVNPVAHGFDEDMDLDSPLLRLASTGECETQNLSCVDGRTAYCIVTNHGQGLDGPRVFIVADAVELEFRARRGGD